jgi:hypothetical protein
MLTCSSRERRQGCPLSRRILDAVESDHGVLQRSLAKELGIALGLTNYWSGASCARAGYRSFGVSPAGNLLLFDRALMNNPAMNAIELIGDIDDQHQLHAQVPKELPTARSA